MSKIMLAKLMTRGRRKGAKRNEEGELVERSTTIMEEHHSMELLPGLPNDITLQVIGTKLPWSTFHTLSSVSSAWRQAVKGREMFAARVRSHSTDKFVVFNHVLSHISNTYGIAVYSLGAKACFQLPPIPGVKSGILEACECLTLDGKIYILGGLKKHTTKLGRKYASKRVYMLDLAGQRQWKKCARMQKRRSNFGCGIIDGKIYVCGGSYPQAPLLQAPLLHEAVRETEVYDPMVDTWTTVMPMPSSREGYEVGVAGNELLVFGGRFFNQNFWEQQANLGGNSIDPAGHVEMYNPITDKWRRLPEGSGGHSTGRTFEKLFMANGRLHSITRSQIFVYDLDNNSKTQLHSVSRRIDSLGQYLQIFAPLAVIAVDDELLAIELWVNNPLQGARRLSGVTLALLQSKGFGTKDKEVVWEKANCSLSFERLWFPFLRPLQL